jgi:hypothetical protein
MNNKAANSKIEVVDGSQNELGTGATPKNTSFVVTGKRNNTKQAFQTPTIAASSNIHQKQANHHTASASGTFN